MGGLTPGLCLYEARWSHQFGKSAQDAGGGCAVGQDREKKEKEDRRKKR